MMQPQGLLEADVTRRLRSSPAGSVVITTKRTRSALASKRPGHRARQMTGLPSSRDLFQVLEAPCLSNRMQAMGRWFDPRN